MGEGLRGLQVPASVPDVSGDIPRERLLGCADHTLTRGKEGSFTCKTGSRRSWTGESKGEGGHQIQPLVLALEQPLIESQLHSRVAADSVLTKLRKAKPQV